MKVNIDNFKNYRSFLISDEEYQKSREERINYLISCDIDEKILYKRSFLPEFIITIYIAEQ